MDDIVKHLVLTCNDEPPVIAVESVTHRKLPRATIAFILEVGGVNIVTCTQKVMKFRGKD